MQRINRTLWIDLTFFITGVVGGATLLILGQRIWLNSGGQAYAVNLANEAQTMGLPLAEESPAYWYVARSGGVVAYLLLWLATIWGIVMSSKMLKGLIGAPLVYTLPPCLNSECEQNTDDYSSALGEDTWPGDG